MDELEPKPDNPELTDVLTVEQIAEACREVLPEEELRDIESMGTEEAIDYIIKYLPEFGVEDPKEFLLEKGLALWIQPNEERARETE